MKKKFLFDENYYLIFPKNSLHIFSYSPLLTIVSIMLWCQTCCSILYVSSTVMKRLTKPAEIAQIAANFPWSMWDNFVLDHLWARLASFMRPTFSCSNVGTKYYVIICSRLRWSTCNLTHLQSLSFNARGCTWFKIFGVVSQ